ncbi:unnamed protein product [Dibothriocephalus latus]|uniref:Uncharacterized protein n=1 Tax=Dibothriocephalus latus TaxID=60516 RepID=A0A3P7M1R3_DIBLA|nr:unnamed protein product [Dibothriocephalus latus]
MPFLVLSDYVWKAVLAATGRGHLLLMCGSYPSFSSSEAEKYKDGLIEWSLDRNVPHTTSGLPGYPGGHEDSIYEVVGMGEGKYVHVGLRAHVTNLVWDNLNAVGPSDALVVQLHCDGITI